MIVKPSISFITTDNDATLITDTTGIITGLTNNAAYPAPAPTLATVQTSLNDFSDAVAAAAGGGVALTSAKNAARAALAALLRELASYVHVACRGDLTKLLTSGFPIQKPTRQPVGVLPAPTGLSLGLAARSGELNAWATPVAGAVLYSWHLVLASAPEVPVQSLQTTAASTSFAGLTPGLEYSITMNAIGTAGPSDWTDPVNQFAI